MSEIITLVSNVQSDNNNTIANFITTLGKKLILKGKWEAAIVEISYTRSWYNVLSPNKIIVIDEIGNIYSNNALMASNELDEVEPKQDIELIISEGYYDSEVILINEINSLLSKLKNIIPPKIHFNGFNKMCTIEAGLLEDTVKVYPILGNEIDQILGLTNRNLEKAYYHSKNTEKITIFNEQDMFKGSFFRAYHPVEISGGYHSLYVYSNFIQPSYIGDTCSQLLRVVEIDQKKKFGDQCCITYENPLYIPVLFNEIDNIELSIKDDTGKLVPFKFGRVIVTLHLRKVK